MALGHEHGGGFIKIDVGEHAVDERNGTGEGRADDCRVARIGGVDGGGGEAEFEA